VKKEFRLTRSKDFKRVRETGTSVYHPLVVLVFSVSDQSQPRMAAVASKAVGNAVVRNFTKRRLKSCLARYSDRIKKDTDLVIFARRDIVNASFQEICMAIENLLLKADLLEN
jgi:ribonuclease P protein component